MNKTAVDPGSEIVLQALHLEKFFRDGRQVRALDDVSLEVRAGEILGIVGESGCGKSTLAKVVSRLIPADSGEIYLCGQEISRKKGSELRQCYSQMQMVFQDAVGSFDPGMKIGRSIEELLENFTDLNKEERQARIQRLLNHVGLKPEYANRRPGQLSGGECQRAAIARAMAGNPRLLICDEATSALDVSMQAQVVEQIYHLSREHNMGILFISHDLALVSSLCDRVMVMYQGKVVEQGDALEVITNPKHEYTKKLRASVFSTQVEE